MESLGLPFHYSRSLTSVYVGKEAVPKSASCQSYKIAGVIFIYPFVFAMESLTQIYFSPLYSRAAQPLWCELVADYVTYTYYFTTSDSEAHTSSCLSLSCSRCSQSSWTQSLLWKWFRTIQEGWQHKKAKMLSDFEKVFISRIMEV